MALLYPFSRKHASIFQILISPACVTKISRPDFSKIKKQKLSFLLSRFLIIHEQLQQAPRPAFPSGHDPS